MGVFYVSGQRSPFIIGRNTGSDLVLTDPSVSRLHLRIVTVTDDAAVAEVLGVNGAVIKGKTINKGNKCYLRPGDMIRAGNHAIIWTGRPQDDTKKVMPQIARAPYPAPDPVEIEAPPPRRVPEKPSIMLAAGPALTMAIPILLGAGRKVAVLSSLFAALWAVMNATGRARRQKAEEKRRKNTYVSYLSQCEEDIKLRLAKAREELNALYPEAAEYLRSGGNPYILWNACPDDEKNLTVRTGRGTIRSPLGINIPKDRFASVDDSLKDLPGMLKKRYEKIPDCPVLAKLAAGSVTGFYLDTEEDRQALGAVIIQLALMYPPGLLRFEVATDADTAKYYMWMKILPHERSEDTCSVCTVITDDVQKAYGMVADGGYVILLGKRKDGFPAGVAGAMNSDHGSADTLPQELCFSYASSMSALWSRKAEKKPIPLNVPFGALMPQAIYGSSDEMKEAAVFAMLADYENNDITARLSAPIGLTEGDGKVFLDLHEKAAGPHGLIAGTTGSGKSELLTCLILSFASRYPPDKLAFFLLDYKGGGMSNLFSDLPHLIGNVSNLSKTDARRAMTALRSENLRRQKMLAEACVNSINDYTRLYDAGAVKVPMPHVLIIIDEFAELRKEEPDFMDSLISVSQVGRSLGMHLILATQKPSGVIDDKIRSNSGFRIALRLVDKSDSMDMLGQPDAAFIKERGRACLQAADRDSLIFFQGGYAMGPAGTGTQRPRIFSDFLMTDELGGGGDEEDSASRITWHEMIMDCIRTACDRRGSPKPPRLFLPALPALISDDEAFAVFDNPYEQKYERAIYEPETMGNVMICGRSGSGKSHLAYLLIRNSGRRAIYIADFGGGVLGKMAGRACCGGYVTDERPDDILRLAAFLSDELTGRRKAPEGPEKRADIVLVLDDYAGIRSAADPEAWEHMIRLLTLGKSAGITVIATIDGTIASREERLFDTVLFLGNEDPYRIASVLKASPRDVPETAACPGRGVGLFAGAVLEFQTVDTGRENRKREDDIRAQKFPYVPAIPTLEALLARTVSERGALTGFPAAYETRTGRIYDLPVGKIRCALIGGKPGKGRHTFLFSISVTAARAGRRCICTRSYEEFAAACAISCGQDIVTVASLSDLLEEFYGRARSRSEEDEAARYFENSPRSSSGDGPFVAAIIENDAAIRFSGRKIYEAAVRNPYVISFGGCLDENRNFAFFGLPFSEIQKSHPRGIATVMESDEKAVYTGLTVPVIFDVDNSQTQ